MNTSRYAIFRFALLRAVERAFHAPPAFVQDMGIDHRRGYIRVSEQFLHRAYVIARLQQLRGKAVPPMSRKT